jgi:hypothetical protein
MPSWQNNLAPTLGFLQKKMQKKPFRNIFSSKFNTSFCKLDRFSSIGKKVYSNVTVELTKESENV